MKKAFIFTLIVLLAVVGAVWFFRYKNSYMNSDTYKHCEELIELIDEVKSPYCKFELDEVFVEDGVLRIEYEYRAKSDNLSNAEKINAFNQIRTEVNNYLLQNEDFYYRDNPILLQFDTPHGNDDDAHYKFIFANYNDYSNETTTTLGDVRTFIGTITSDLQGVYGLRSMETVVSSPVTVDSYFVFENNPQLKYCKLRCDNPEEAEKKIKSLCPNCVVEWM